MCSVPRLQESARNQAMYPLWVYETTYFSHMPHLILPTVPLWKNDHTDGKVRTSQVCPQLVIWTQAVLQELSLHRNVGVLVTGEPRTFSGLTWPCTRPLRPQTGCKEGQSLLRSLFFISQNCPCPDSQYSLWEM